MRILILSNYPWKNNNSFGNTYSSIFGKIPNVEIAHVYMFDGMPDDVPNVTRYYQILEKDVMKSAFKRVQPVGREVFVGQDFEGTAPGGGEKKSLHPYSRLLSFGKRHHWYSLFFARELAWKLGKVNFEDLMSFIDDFKPDIFFLPYSYVFYTNRIALYIKEHYDIPMVMEMAMDHYTLKRVSWNPLFWLDRFAKRKQIRKLVEQSEMMFVISKKLKEEIESHLNIKCQVLYKTPDACRSIEAYKGTEKVVKFLFTGNIYSNRWKSLAMLAQSLKKQDFGHLDIYTASPITPAISKSLNIDGYSEIHPPVSQAEVINLQNKADVLVHAEAFDSYNKSLVRCAISTKIMDYLSVGRCILAIGPSDISSIEYLSENKIALVADSQQTLDNEISKIKVSPQIISEFAQKSQDYSQKHLNSEEMRQKLYNDLQLVIDNYKQK